MLRLLRLTLLLLLRFRDAADIRLRYAVICLLPLLLFTPLDAYFSRHTS